MDSAALLQLLIVTDQSQQANRLISLLRQAQLTLRASCVGSLAALEKQLQAQAWDVVVCAESTGTSLAQVLGALHDAQQAAPLIHVRATAAQGLSLPAGVFEVVVAEPEQLLVHAVQRAASIATLQQQHNKLLVRHKALEKRFDTLLATSTTPLCYLQDGMHLYCNEHYAQFFGYDNSQNIRVKPFLDLVASTERDALKPILRKAAQAEQLLTVKILCADNSEQNAELQLSPVDYHGKACVQVRVTPAPGNPAYNSAVARLSTLDLVTQVANRDHFLDKLDAAIGKAVHQADYSTLLVLELCEFDELKSAIGVAHSNYLLNDVAQFLQSLGEGAAVVGRIDDAQFALLLAGNNVDENLQLLQMVKERCQGYLAAAMPNSLAMQVEIGMALINGHAASADALLTRARHWQSGMAESPLQPEVMQAAAPNAKELLNYLGEALAEKRFTLYFQPIVPIKGGSNHGYEVLIRMIDREGNEIRPGQFLPLAILNGMGETIDRMVLELVLASPETAADDGLLIVNLTSATLASPAFLPWLNEQLVKRRFNAQRLVLELSEIDLHAKPTQAVSFCQQASQLGVNLALSHFGTAVEPFAIFDQFKPAFVTLDESVVRDIMYSTQQKSSVQALIESLHKRNMLVVAPQVENMDVLPILWSAGADLVQGYCLQAPARSMNYAFVQEEEITLTAPEQ